MKDITIQVQAIIDEIKSKENLDELGKDVVEIIKKRTRLGYGCSEEGNKERLEPLSPSYVKTRKDWKKTGHLSSATSPAKSNLTLTGEMIDSLESSANNEGELFIELSDDFSRRKAIWNSEMGRPFMGLTKQEEKRVTDLIKDKVAKLVKNLK